MCIRGLASARDGAVRFEGRDLRALPAHARAGLGIGSMPEDRRQVPEFTVDENVLPVCASGQEARPGVWRGSHEAMPQVRHLRARKASQLSGKQQKRRGPRRALLAGRLLRVRVNELKEAFDCLASGRPIRQVLVV